MYKYHAIAVYIDYFLTANVVSRQKVLDPKLLRKIDVNKHGWNSVAIFL